MEQHIQSALENDKTIDITTTGRKTGTEQRLEIWFHNVDGRIYITGTPGTRDWYANLLANPHFTFHLKESASVDLPATAAPVAEPAERRRLFQEITRRVGQVSRLEEWVLRSPLVEVRFP